MRWTERNQPVGMSFKHTNPTRRQPIPNMRNVEYCNQGPILNTAQLSTATREFFPPTTLDERAMPAASLMADVEDVGLYYITGWGVMTYQYLSRNVEPSPTLNQ